MKELLFAWLLALVVLHTILDGNAYRDLKQQLNRIEAKLNQKAP